jgi:hypothetical protein
LRAPLRFVKSAEVRFAKFVLRNPFCKIRFCTIEDTSFCNAVLQAKSVFVLRAAKAARCVPAVFAPSYTEITE